MDAEQHLYLKSDYTSARDCVSLWRDCCVDSLWVSNVGGIDEVVHGETPVCSVSLHHARDEHEAQNHHVDAREYLAHQRRLAHAK